MNPVRTLTLLSFANLVTSLIYTWIIARQFGAERSIEIFFAATTLNNLLYKLLQSGHIADVFTPIYHQQSETYNKTEAFASFSCLINSLIGISIPILIFLAASRHFFIGILIPGFSPEDQAEAAHIFLLLLPLIPLNIVNSLLESTLNAESQFGKPESTKITGQTLQIIVIILLLPTMGITALLFGLWTLGTYRLLIYTIYIHKLGYRHQLRLKTKHFSIFTISKNISSTLSHVSAAQILHFTITASISKLPQGFLAIYNYAQKFEGVLLAITSRPSSLVFFIKFSKQISTKTKDLQKSVQTAIKNNLSISLFIASLSIPCLPHLLNIALSKETFEPDKIEYLSEYCTIIALMNSLFCLGQIYRRIVVSSGHSTLYYFGTAIAQITAAPIFYYMVIKFGFSGLIASSICLNLLFSSPAIIITILKKLQYPPFPSSKSLMMSLAPPLLATTASYIALLTPNIPSWLTIIAIAAIYIPTYFVVCKMTQSVNGLKLLTQSNK